MKTSYLLICLVVSVSFYGCKKKKFNIDVNPSLFNENTDHLGYTLTRDKINRKQFDSLFVYNWDVDGFCPDENSDLYRRITPYIPTNHIVTYLISGDFNADGLSDILFVAEWDSIEIIQNIVQPILFIITAKDNGSYSLSSMNSRFIAPSYLGHKFYFSGVYVEGKNSFIIGNKGEDFRVTNDSTFHYGWGTVAKFEYSHYNNNWFLSESILYETSQMDYSAISYIKHTYTKPLIPFCFYDYGEFEN